MKSFDTSGYTKLASTFKNRVEKYREVFIFFFYLIIMTSPVLLFSILILIGVYEYAVVAFFTFGFFLLIFIIPIFRLKNEIVEITMINPITKTIHLLVEHINSINLLISENIEKIQNLDEILLRLTKSHSLILTLQKIHKYGSYLFKFTKYDLLCELNMLIQNNITWILQVLINLRSDLNIRLTKQQSTLKSAKSEVSVHIRGTDELNQVSELQRQRLDKQIEQFEELQRVLVKV